jgi:hypothetical protein
LYCSSVWYFLVESTSFFSCKTSNYIGGAIYFSNDNGQCVLHKVCGYNCCSTYTSGSSSGQFIDTNVNNDASSKNYVNYSSITRCVNSISNSHFTLNLNYGKICCPSINISMNRCEYYPGIRFCPLSYTSSVICSLSYFLITDNNAFGYICIGFNQNAKYEMKYCNFLRNDSTSYGIIHTPRNWMIEDSCILDNLATCIFNIWSSTLTLSNCTVDKTTSSGSLTIKNTVTKSFIHGLNHVSTQNCHSEYDSAGILTAVPYVSSPTKKVFCYTYKINDYQARVSDFFSFNCVYMIIFIHPNPSIYY